LVVEVLQPRRLHQDERVGWVKLGLPIALLLVGKHSADAAKLFFFSACSAFSAVKRSEANWRLICS
jgi:hypothetical protein